MRSNKQNLEAFAEWSSCKTHDEFSLMVYRGSLNREKIALACGFTKSALRQNPAIKAALLALEDRLRSEGILPDVNNGQHDTAAKLNAGADAQQTVTEICQPFHSDSIGATETPSQRARPSSLESTIRRLQSENASQRAEIHELRHKLAKLTALQDALSKTGRLPR